MIGLVAGWLVPLVGEKASRAAAWVALIILAGGLAWAGLKLYNANVIENATNKANADFQQDKDQAEGEADLDSDGRKAEHEVRVKTTGELIDEAIEKGCAVGEYLASDGANCVQ